jgi:nitrous oxidase accessory protein
MDRRVMAGFILALITLPSVAVSVTAESDVLVVPDDYATIQAAIDAAGEGSTVHVKAGSYHENLEINKSISLVGASCFSVFVDGNTSEPYGVVPCRICCSGVNVSGFTFSEGRDGVQLMSGVCNCSISGNRLINNEHGILASMGSGNRFVKNLITSATYGIYLLRSSNCLVEANKIASSSEGIAVFDDLLSPQEVTASFENQVLGNTLFNITDKAVWFKFTRDNLMVGNNITACKIGLALLYADNNMVYQNNFVGNTYQVAGGLEPIWSGGSGTRYSVCQWCNGSVGNYWSDYNGTDQNGNGIGDAPYVINEANSDENPLMNPVSLKEIALSIEVYEDLASPALSPSASPSSPVAEPVSMGQVIAVLASTTVAIVGLWLYFRKPKPEEAH